MRPAGDAWRWGLCFALALAFHVGGIAALMARWNDSPDAVASAPVILIELSPAPVAPQTQPTDLPPGPQQVEAQPQPEPIKPLATLDLEPKPDPAPELVTAAIPPPKPSEPEPPKLKREQRAKLTTAPSPAERKSHRAAAPAAGAAARNPNAIPSWTSRVAAQLERYKRYPAEARTRGEQGVARLAFTIDRHGGVHRARIVRSSGSMVLDRETLALLNRAQPLPPPPAEISGAQIAITVPIRYTMR
jgi:protein TonB